MRKKTALLIAMCLGASLVFTACSSETETTEEAVIEVETEGTAEVIETAYDPSGLISGLDDFYVLEGSEDIDFEEGLEYDTDIVTGIIVDDSDVDLLTPGVYAVSYTLIVDDDALGEEPIEDIVVYRTVEVVDEDRAVELAAEGKTVWCGNDTVVEILDEEDPELEEVQTAKEDVTSTVSEEKDSASENSGATGNSGSRGTTKDSTTSSSSTKSNTNSTSSSSTKSNTNSTSSSSTKNSTSGSSTKNSTSGSSSSSTKNSTSNSSTKSNTSSSSSSSSSSGSTKSSSSGSSSSSSASTHTHSYTSKVTKAATCTTAGVRTYTCSCGDSYTKSIAATGHSYSSKTTKAATCTTAGTKTYTCSKCGNSYTESIAATGHTWVSTYHAATGHYESVLVKAAYDEKVFVRYAEVCENCGYVFPEGSTDMATHCRKCNYSNWLTDVPIYETVHHDAVYENQWVQDSAAYYTYKCSVCGATK